LDKYFKFITHWNSLDRWAACNAKKTLNAEAYSEFCKIVNETQLDIVHIKGTLLLCELASSMSTQQFEQWKRLHRRQQQLSEENLHEDVSTLIANSPWKNFAPAFNKFKVVAS
jgi:hypothetical protein